MKKLLYIFIIGIFMCFNSVFALEEQNDSNIILNDIELQKRIDNVGFKILNANKIDERIVFLYQKKDKKIKGEPGLTKRQIVIYKNTIQFAENEDEIAALLSPEICKSAESFTGPWKGLVSSVQVKCAAKKYELFCDKRAVDFMVMAGYNPVALITFINKAFPQKRFDKISNYNLTSKRLANIYEYIYLQYPQFLANNKYLYNESYQNFLMTSINNRKKIQEKIQKGSKEKIKYE